MRRRKSTRVLRQRFAVSQSADAWDNLEQFVGGNRLENYEVKVRASFARQQMMKTLGAELSAVGRGATEIRFPFAESLSQQHGYLHAGAVTSILDSACGYAALTVAPQGSEVLSVEFKVNLLSPANGDSFLARANVKRAGRTLAVCAADAFAVTSEGERLIATMLATMIYVRDDRQDMVREQEKPGAS